MALSFFSESSNNIAQKGFALGNTYLDLNNFGEALNKYDDAQANGFNSPDLYLNKGACYINLQQIQQAIENFKVGAKLFPLDSRLSYNLGTILDNQEDHLEAIVAFDNAINSNSKNVLMPHDIIFYQRASAKDSLSKLSSGPAKIRLGQSALNDINKAIELSATHDVDYYYLKGFILKRGNNLEEALKSWKIGAQLGDAECHKLYSQYYLH